MSGLAKGFHKMNDRYWLVRPPDMGGVKLSYVAPCPETSH